MTVRGLIGLIGLTALFWWRVAATTEPDQAQGGGRPDALRSELIEQYHAQTAIDMDRWNDLS